MKKLLVVLVLCASLWTNVQGQIAFGVGATYVAGTNGTFGVQANSMIGLSDKLDISPSATFWFEDNVDFSVDADLHYQLLQIGDGFSLNPFAGINYTGGTDNSIAINLGLSLQIATENGAIYLEPKYVIDVFDSFAFTAGYFF